MFVPSPGLLLPARALLQCRRSADGFVRVLAAIALSLQIAVPNFHAPVLFGSHNSSGQFSGAVDEHALCLARGPVDTEKPDNDNPKPVHHEFPACCFWHGVTSLAIAPDAILEAVAFIRSRVVFTPPRQFAQRRLNGSIGARAPPGRA
jgi:hypothetical protein